MNIMDSFVFKSIYNYIDLKYLQDVCSNNGYLNIKQNSIKGECFYKESKIYINVYMKNNKLIGKVVKNDEVEIFTACKTENGYTSQYIKKETMQNSTNYSQKTIKKETNYNLEKKFLLFRENVENVHKIRYDNKNFVLLEPLCKKTEELTIRIDDNNLLKRDKEIVGLIEKNNYSISNDFKEGVFLSGGIVLPEYYLAFEKIEEEEYKKLVRK